MSLYILMCRCQDMNQQSPPEARMPVGYVTAASDAEAKAKADGIFAELEEMRRRKEVLDLRRDIRVPQTEPRYINLNFYCVPAYEVQDAADVILSNTALFGETSTFARYVESLQPA